MFFQSRVMKVNISTKFSSPKKLFSSSVNKSQEIISMVEKSKHEFVKIAGLFFSSLFFFLLQIHFFFKHLILMEFQEESMFPKQSFFLLPKKVLDFVVWYLDGIQEVEAFFSQRVSIIFFFFKITIKQTVCMTIPKK